jgi:predicted transcriptional regulator
MIEQLFGSKTRVKLLQLFYSNPNRSFYVREITRKIDEQINSVRRELANLLSIGIITSDTTNNKLYYEVDQKYEYYKPLAAIFGGAVLADEAEGEVLIAPEQTKQPLKELGNVELALYTGQFTRDERSGVDFLVVGDVNQTQVQKYVEQLEKKEDKEVRYVVMTADEFAYRKQVNDRFLHTILESKNQVIVDKLGIFVSNDQKEAKKES